MVEMHSVNNPAVLIGVWKAKSEERSQNVSGSAQVEILRAELG